MGGARWTYARNKMRLLSACKYAKAIWAPTWGALDTNRDTIKLTMEIKPEVFGLDALADVSVGAVGRYRRESENDIRSIEEEVAQRIMIAWALAAFLCVLD